MLFAATVGEQCFWSYTQSDDEISLIIDESSLEAFPAAAIVGSSTRCEWPRMRACMRLFLRIAHAHAHRPAPLCAHTDIIAMPCVRWLPRRQMATVTPLRQVVRL